MAIHAIPSCFWCERESSDLTDDHVIPRALGGTKQFSVMACSDCQTILSKAEFEASRKSILAIHALATPLSARHPRRGASGHLQPTYMLVKHPLGGYGETWVAAGERMGALPHIEIKVVPDEPVEGRIRGASGLDAQRLLDTFRLVLQKKPGPDGLVCEHKVSLDIAPDISADPDFWPRIVLLPGDRTLLRARNPEELIRFMNVFMQIVVSDYKIDLSAWQNGDEIKGGTPHFLALSYDPQTLRRVVAKIALGLFSIIAERSLHEVYARSLRQYILGLDDSTDEPVYEEDMHATVTTDGEPHYVILSPPYARTSAIVCIYKYRFLVDLGPSGVLDEPVVLMCEVDGSGMRIAPTLEGVLIIQSCEQIAFSQAWKQAPDEKL